MPRRPHAPALLAPPCDRPATPCAPTLARSRRRRSSALCCLALALGVFPLSSRALVGSPDDPVSDVAAFVEPGGEPHVVVLTRGQLIDLRRPPVGLPVSLTLGYFEAPRGLGAQFMPPPLPFPPLPRFPRAAVVGRDGRLTLVTYDPRRPGEGGALLAWFTPGSIVDLASFATDDDRTEHFLTVNDGAAVSDTVLSSGGGVTTLALGSFVGRRADAVAGFADPLTGERVAAVALDKSEVAQIVYRPDGSVLARERLAVFASPVVSIGAFYTGDDRRRHVMVATRDGAVTELFYRDAAAVGRVVVGRMASPPVALDGYFTAGDGLRHVIVALESGEVREIAFSPASGVRESVVTSFAFPVAASTQDISPRVAIDQRFDQQPRASSAGIAVALAGDHKGLYAVAQNAGVYKSVDGGPWVKLLRSPRYAYSIAVDPGNPAHVVVGERSGDASDTRLEDVGVWESNDGGATWSYLLDPLRWPIACHDRYINAVAFSPPVHGLTTLFVTTPCGVARKPAGAGWHLLRTPTGLEPGALAVAQTEDGSRTLVAARLFGTPFGVSDGALWISEDDGVTWTARTLPKSVAGANLAWGSRGDQFSLAAFDRRLVTNVTDVTDPKAAMTALLFHDVDSNAWSVQRLNTGDGTGLGGRRFVRAFVSEDRAKPWRVGERLQLLASNGNDLERATADLGGGVYRWEVIGPYQTRNLHVDLWDALYETADHFADPAVWVANDGGVAEAHGFAVPLPWSKKTDGMHTHHIHDFVLLSEGSLRRPKLLYSTSDNDEWFRQGYSYVDPQTSFRIWGLLGDSNVTRGDTGSPRLGLVYRHLLSATLTDFQEPPPPGAGRVSDASFIVLNCGQRAVDAAGRPFCDGSSSSGMLRVVETPLGERSEPYLDMVMMVTLPLNWFDPGRNDVVPVPGPLGAVSSGGAPVLVRRVQFTAPPGPDANRDHRFDTAVGWMRVSPDPPATSRNFWVSGGHANPTYFAWADGSLFRLMPGAPSWTRIYDGSSDPILTAFPNPWDPQHVFLLTWTTVRVTIDGGLTWLEDRVLDDLATGMGKFRRGRYQGGNFGRLAAQVSHANVMATINHMAFNRENPHEVVAVAPFTGVFRAADDLRRWRRVFVGLGTQIPSWVAIDGDSIYVSTEGNGIHQARGFRHLPPELRFERDGAGVRLVDTLGAPRAGVSVQARVWSAGGEPRELSLTSAADGRVPLPALEPGTAVRALARDEQLETPLEVAFVAGAPAAAPIERPVEPILPGQSWRGPERSAEPGANPDDDLLESACPLRVRECCSRPWLPECDPRRE